MWYFCLFDLHIKECCHPDRKASQGDWVKDLLLRYVQLLPQVSCHLEINVGRAIYGQGCFRSFTFLEMWQWYSLYKTIQADPQAGTDHERKMPQVAYCSVQQCLVMKEDIVTTKFKVPLVKNHGATLNTIFKAEIHLYFTETSTGRGSSRSSCQLLLIRVQRWWQLVGWHSAGGSILL